MNTKPRDKESINRESIDRESINRESINKDQILKRIQEINRFMSRSYSQSDPGHMMERRQCRKELEKLQGLLQ